MSDHARLSTGTPASVQLQGSRDDLAVLAGRVVASASGVRYRIERPLGGGDQAAVLLATRLGPAGEDPVALKVFRPAFVRSFPELSRTVLTKESVALTRLARRVPPSPFVVRLLDHGELDLDDTTVPWLALEYVHGGALGGDLFARVHEALDTTGFAFSPLRAQRLLGCVVAGLNALHDEGVVHRDLRPSNILMCGTGDDELAKVADLGGARPKGVAATFDHGTYVGEIGYAAPEQRHDAHVGPWSDVFSLAAVTTFVLSGEPMFKGSGPVALASTYNGRFEPVASRAKLHPAWKADGGAALAEIDHVLRQAVIRDTAARIPSAKAYWAALAPLIKRLTTTPDESRASRVACRDTLKSAARDPWTFKRRFTPKAPFELCAAAVDPDGHALAASRRGLFYWEGSSFIRAMPPPFLRPHTVRRLIRLAPARWLAIGDQGEIETFEPETCAAYQRLAGDPRLSAACLIGEEGFVVAGVDTGRSVVHTFDGTAFRAPASLPGVTVTALLATSPEEVLIAGFDRAGQGQVWCFRLGRDVTNGSVHPARLRALAATPEGALVTGDGGYTCFLASDGSVAQNEPPIADVPLTHCAVDPAGTAWAAGFGKILRRDATGAARPWSVAWSDPSPTSPFITLAAFSGLVLALAEDGSVVTGHQAL